MGMKYFSDSESDTKIESPNPNPEVFNIVKASQYGEYVIAKIHYPGCTTFKGNKILVFELTIEKLNKRIKIDPHFLEKDKSLIARFPSTDEGWNNAILFLSQKILPR